jgi:hypothetical protein
MQAEHHRRIWRTRTASLTGTIVLGCAIVSAIATATTTAAGAAPTPQFGAPTGFGCTGVGMSQSPTTSFTSLGLPVYAWNGVPLLGLLEASGRVDKQALVGPSCGDFAHGSSEFGVAGSGRNGFSAGATGAVAAASTVHTNPSNPLMGLLGQSVFVYGQSEQVAYVTPQIGPGTQSFTITVTYTILSSSSTAPPASVFSISNWAGTALSYTSSAASPSCNGQPVLGDQSGDFLADAPGTYTAQTEFSCPPGQTLTDSEALGVTFNVVQSGWFQAGPQGADYAGRIVAEPDSVTVSAG